MNLVVLSLAFGAGVATFFSPCGIGLLPGYISYIISRKENSNTFSVKIFEGLKFGIVAGLGMISIFLVLGIIVSLFGNFLAPYAFWFGSIAGIFLIILGLLMLAGKNVHIIPKINVKTESKSPIKTFFLIGVGYATGGLACTFPAFLLVVFVALGSGTFLGGLYNFIAFSAGAFLAMIFVTVSASVARTFVAGLISKYLRTARVVISLFIIFGGAYLIWFNARAIVIKVF